MVRSLCPGMKIETLIPDFQGDINLVKKYVRPPDVLAHNLETVKSFNTIYAPNVDILGL
ncbi:MAG: hypothetical protein CM1200mP16_14250 [Nitrospina sp.]|nr:MAG: hypothetical protein CM1200mP16_14250 [Nitrospina sp.]